MAKKKTSARSRQRHRALDVVFEADERGLLDEESLLALLAERQKISTAQVPIGDFGSDIVRAYAHNMDDIDTIIEAASEDWALARMNSVDRNILRCAAGELMYCGTSRTFIVPEYAALARELSTERSVGFVMGILNKIADIRARELGDDTE